MIIFFSQLIEPIILNHVKYPFRLHLQSWVCIRIRYQLNSTFCLWVFEHSVCLILYIFSSTDDHSRVVLTAKRDIPGSDYINANYVDVRKLVCWSIWFTLILKAIFFFLRVGLNVIRDRIDFTSSYDVIGLENSLYPPSQSSAQRQPFATKAFVFCARHSDLLHINFSWAPCDVFLFSDDAVRLFTPVLRG